MLIIPSLRYIFLSFLFQLFAYRRTALKISFNTLVNYSGNPLPYVIFHSLRLKIYKYIS